MHKASRAEEGASKKRITAGNEVFVRSVFGPPREWKEDNKVVAASDPRTPPVVQLHLCHVE